MAANPACQTFIPQLSPYVDGELSPADRVVLERHLSACKGCTGRAADLRAESGMIRVGLDMAADDVDFKDFAQKVMARVTPERPPLLERWRISLGELWRYQRGPMFASMAGAAAALAIALPFILKDGAPVGYASPQMAVQSVASEDQAKVAPVVMTTESGDAIIWLVEKPEQAPEAQSEEMEMEAPAQPMKPLDTERPEGGEL